jgi:hypothetical protein
MSGKENDFGLQVVVAILMTKSIGHTVIEVKEGIPYRAHWMICCIDLTEVDSPRTLPESLSYRPLLLQ